MPRSPIGPMEDQIAKAFVAFEKEYMGRGPKEAECHILRDMALVRLSKVLTPAEQHLAKNQDGIELVKRMRSNLLEGAREMIYAVIQDITGCKVVSMHTDLSTMTGERVFVFTLDQSPDRASN